MPHDNNSLNGSLNWLTSLSVQQNRYIESDTITPQCGRNQNSLLTVRDKSVTAKYTVPMSMHTHHVLDSQSGTGVGSLHDASGGCDADLYPPVTVPVRGEVGIVPPTLAGTQVGDPNLGDGSIVGRSADSNSWLSTNLA